MNLNKRQQRKQFNALGVKGLVMRRPSARSGALAGFMPDSDWMREIVLGDAGRIDLYSKRFRIGVECKVKGGAPALTEQILRYADRDEIDGLLVVSASPHTVRLLPIEARGKPVVLVEAWKTAAF